jgi:hypothetical protein
VGAAARVEVPIYDNAELRQAQAAYASMLELARGDCALFNELVLRDEESGDPIEMLPVHYEWHENADSGRNMVLWAYPESGKSQQFSIGRVLWLLGRNPRLRIAILAAAERQVKKIIAALRRHIESNKTLHLIFPELRRGDLWTDSAISVARPGIIKDPSVQAVSPNGAVQGARLDLVIIDDVLVEENTRTAYQRKKIGTWIRASAFSRLSKKSQVIMLANAFHPDDFAHELARSGWLSKKYPVLDEHGNSNSPTRWPMSRIEKVRDEELGPTEFARMMLCQARADEDARFQKKWIDACKKRGLGYSLFKSLREAVDFIGDDYWQRKGLEWAWGTPDPFPPGFCVFTGVDLGVSKKDAADPTVLFTFLLWPDGTRQILDVRRGRWQSPQIIRNVVDVWRRYGTMFFVENNAAQQYLVEWLAEDYPNIVVRGFRTGVNKHNRAYGVESIASELERAKWLVPCGVRAVNGQLQLVMAPVLQIWEQELLYYSPDGHTGDCLMAQWIGREAARAWNGVRRTAEVRVVG